jgi:hypothetical protein
MIVELCSYCGANRNPDFDHVIRIEQRITLDFIDYVKSGSIEFEVR